ncbi:MAG: hypothetical protein U0941_20010 [Planctomycetaceae bacterium]
MRIKDQIVCIEMTGTYHLIVWRTFRQAGFEHDSFIPSHPVTIARPENGSIKTDDNDLIAIFRRDQWLRTDRADQR